MTRRRPRGRGRLGSGLPGEDDYLVVEVRCESCGRRLAAIDPPLTDTAGNQVLTVGGRHCVDRDSEDVWTLDVASGAAPHPFDWWFLCPRCGPRSVDPARVRTAWERYRIERRPIVVPTETP